MRTIKVLAARVRHRMRGHDGPECGYCVVGVWVGYRTQHFLANPRKCNHCEQLYVTNNAGEKTAVCFIARPTRENA